MLLIIVCGEEVDIDGGGGDGQHSLMHSFPPFPVIFVVIEQQPVDCSKSSQLTF